MESTCTKHCFCRTRTEAADVFGIGTRRVRYCCWCGAERGAPVEHPDPLAGMRADKMAEDPDAVGS